MLIVASMTTTVHGDVITVCESGCDHTSIIAALQNADNDDVIQLSAQLYREGEEIVLDKEVTVMGAVDEFGNPTSRIDGQGLHRVMRATDSIVLENLIITGGHAERGGGFLDDSGFHIFNNCRFDGNFATESGAACHVEHSAEFRGCKFLNHDSVPVLTIIGQSIIPPIDQCLITDCTFTNNNMPLYLYFMNYTIRDCTFTDNNALQNAPVVLVDSSGSIEDSTFARQSGDVGGAIVTSRSYLMLNNCQLHENTPNVISNWQSTVEMENSRIWCSGPEPIAGKYTDLGNNCIRTDCQSCDPKADDDGDGVPNDQDVCADHDDNIDTDGDGTPDGCDDCPNDPLKIDPGACGCGNPDVDSDQDGTLDCFDGCPEDPDKIEPGNCGCHVPETTVFGDLDCDGDYDQDDIRLGMEQFGISEASSCPAAEASSA